MLVLNHTHKFLRPPDLILKDRTLCEPFDLLLDRVVLVCPGVFSGLSRLWVVIAELEDLLPVCTRGQQPPR